ncbi:MAG: hypothetical protein FWF36_04420 [Propionibacteriaceae bacterium]|nr:hypothetical protein [Propionibacteriaceae bacterium]
MNPEYASMLRQLALEFGGDIIDKAADAAHERLQGARRDLAVTDDNLAEDEPDAQVIDDAEYQDEDAFSDKVIARVGDITSGPITTPQQVVGAVRDLVLMAGEVRKFEEAQITKRMGIAAERDIAVAKIEAQTAFLRDYLDKTFDERAENFQAFFGVIDNALATNNMQELSMGLESVIRLADSSPFKDLRTVQETTAALLDEDHEWDF